MILYRVQPSASYTILAATNSRGSCLLLNFLSVPPGGRFEKEILQMINLLERVSHTGPPHRREVSRILRDGIFEFKRGSVRILYFYDANHIIVCTHGFQKQSRQTARTPDAEIEKAIRLRDRYFQDKASGNNEVREE